jgi:hypothetical protein
MSLVETLQRYRGKAPQEVKVEHVHVNEGGQAIVGKVGIADGPEKRVAVKQPPKRPDRVYPVVKNQEYDRVYDWDHRPD